MHELPREDACLRFHELRRPVLSVSRVQVRCPLYAHSVERWKNYRHALGDVFARLEPDTR